MEFTASGTLLGRPCEVTWADGVLSGDPALCGMVKAIASAAEGTAVGPPVGPFTYHNHIASGMSTVCLLKEVFDADPILSGDIPKIPSLPAGAVA